MGRGPGLCGGRKGPQSVPVCGGNVREVAGLGMSWTRRTGLPVPRAGHTEALTTPGDALSLPVICPQAFCPTSPRR